MPVIQALFQDPFSPVLLSSSALDVTQEQKDYIKKVLDKACSDSRFAEKAYVAIAFILAGGSATVPEITSLNPGSVTLGDPDFTLHVLGSGFSTLSKIIFNGSEEPTTYVSDTELTTGVNMATAITAATVPVHVVSGDGVLSNAVNFVFQDGGTPLVAVAAKEPVVKSAPAIPTTPVKK
jgi:hypothetical protein